MLGPSTKNALQHGHGYFHRALTLSVGHQTIKNVKTAKSNSGKTGGARMTTFEKMHYKS